MTSGRRRLLPWLLAQAQSGRFPGLEFDDAARSALRVPWERAGRGGAGGGAAAALCQAWAEYKGATPPPGPAVCKTRLRCALHKSPELQEVPERARLDGPRPYKVYRLLGPRPPRNDPAPQPRGGGGGGGAEPSPAPSRCRDPAPFPPARHPIGQPGAPPPGRRRRGIGRLPLGGRGPGLEGVAPGGRVPPIGRRQPRPRPRPLAPPPGAGPAPPGPGGAGGGAGPGAAGGQRGAGPLPQDTPPGAGPRPQRPPRRGAGGRGLAPGGGAAGGRLRQPALPGGAAAAPPGAGPPPRAPRAAGGHPRGASHRGRGQRPGGGATAGAGPGPAPPGPRAGSRQLKPCRILPICSIFGLILSVFARFPPFSPQIRAAPSHWLRRLQGDRPHVRTRAPIGCAVSMGTELRAHWPPCLRGDPPSRRRALIGRAVPMATAR
ncbi:interferon regulatory factor 9 isoform X1 [Anas platyrhynchos]|uniref:interferon regulatory factor 9 isoform X1 n=1 Tax=Anas platyrhynchos TaxID=8839 RepID=UPI003AF23F11